MTASLRRNLLVALAGIVFWLLFALAGWGGWGLFLPLVFFAVLVPAVLAGTSEGPFLARVVTAMAPSVIVGIVVLGFPELVGDWSPLVWQAVLGGAGVVFLGMVLVLPWRRHAS